MNAVEILVNEQRPDIDRKSSSEFAPCRLQDVIVWQKNLHRTLNGMFSGGRQQNYPPMKLFNII